MATLFVVIILGVVTAIPIVVILGMLLHAFFDTLIYMLKGSQAVEESLNNPEE